MLLDPIHELSNMDNTSFVRWIDTFALFLKSQFLDSIRICDMTENITRKLHFHFSGEENVSPSLSKVPKSTIYCHKQM